MFKILGNSSIIVVLISILSKNRYIFMEQFIFINKIHTAVQYFYNSLDILFLVFLGL